MPSEYYKKHNRKIYIDALDYMDFRVIRFSFGELTFPQSIIVRSSLPGSQSFILSKN